MKNQTKYVRYAYSAGIKTEHPDSFYNYKDVSVDRDKVVEQAFKEAGITDVTVKTNSKDGQTLRQNSTGSSKQTRSQKRDYKLGYKKRVCKSETRVIEDGVDKI